MQTFLPSRDLLLCAKFLDRQRLGKQRVEALQIANALITERLTYDPRGYHLPVKKGWLHHPAVKMWRGHEGFLLAYTSYIMNEWVIRGYDNTKCKEWLCLIAPCVYGETCVPPPWWHDDRIFSSHRAALLAKNYEWYSQFGWAEEPKLDYFWPV